MVIVIDSSGVNCGFHPTIIKLTICCLPIKNALILRKSKYGLFRGQDNVSEWSDIPIWTVVSLSYHYKNSIEQMLISLIQNRLHHHLIKMLLVVTTKNLKKELNNTDEAGLNLCSQWFKFISTNEKGQWEQKRHPDGDKTISATNILFDPTEKKTNIIWKKAFYWSHHNRIRLKCLTI